jgi:hypothetical protein
VLVTVEVDFSAPDHQIWRRNDRFLECPRTAPRSALFWQDHCVAELNHETSQRQVCRRFDVEPEPPAQGTKLGVALNVRGVTQPLHGLRHPPEDGTNGWYLWRGEYSQDPEFFVPLHIDHLDEWCPDAMPYLALPPGWRFLLAPDHEDVWFESSLLDI